MTEHDLGPMTDCPSHPGLSCEEAARYEAIGFCVNLLVIAVTHVEHREARRALFIQGLDTIAKLIGPHTRVERMDPYDYEHIEN